MSLLSQLFAKAARQLSEINEDLRLLETSNDTSPAAQGKVSAGLSSLQRTLTSLDDMVTREMIPEKRDLNRTKLNGLYDDYASIKASFEKFKRKLMEDANAMRRQELLSGPTTSSMEAAATEMKMQDYQQRDGASLERSIDMVDSYILQGKEALDNLKKQGERLKWAQRRILDVANTLGLSQTTIKWIERRTTEDKYIFWAGVVIVLVVMFLAMTYL